MVEFRKLNEIVINNVRFKGFYEEGLKPIELICNANLYIVPTEYGKLNKDEFDYAIKIMLYKGFLRDNVNRILNDWLHDVNWVYDGSRYTYNHDVTKICHNQNNQFGIDLYFVSKIDNIKLHDINKFYKHISQLISLSIFQPNDCFELLTKNKRNGKKENE